MSTLGERLREVRTALRMNQSDFAAAAGVQKRAQIHYEGNERMPDARYLTAIAAIGADVQYVLTGMPLPDELYETYRRAAIASLQALDPALAEGYVGSLPAIALARQQVAESERQLLSDFRLSSPEDQSTIAQLAARLAAGKRPRRSEGFETSMVFHGQVGSVNKLDQGDMHVTHHHGKPPKDKKPPK